MVVQIVLTTIPPSSTPLRPSLSINLSQERKFESIDHPLDLKIIDFGFSKAYGAELMHRSL